MMFEKAKIEIYDLNDLGDIITMSNEDDFNPLVNPNPTLNNAE